MTTARRTQLVTSICAVANGGTAALQWHLGHPLGVALSLTMTALCVVLFVVSRRLNRPTGVQ